MPRYYYDRLSAQDTSFLVFEGPNTHMHVGGAVIYEVGGLTSPRGGVDVARIRRYIESRLNWIPRYRQRLVQAPFGGSTVWVDDENFNLGYHVRHTSLPRPGSERQLKRLCARILSQQLDRGKPLWETWIVEGLEGNRFAMLSKLHHCMIDGASGVDLSTVLMRATTEDTIDEPPEWIPRPAPDSTELLREEVLRRVSGPIQLARRLRGALADPNAARESAGEVLGAIWELLESGLQGAADTPLNQPIGPHRRFDWWSQDLNAVKFVKNRLGGTVNDVVLTTVSGALRRFLRQRGVNLNRVDYRAAVPVNMRGAHERGRLGNRVSAWLTTLPLQERDPRRRLDLIRQVTDGLKESKQALAAEALTQMLDWAGSSMLLTFGIQLMGSINPYNMIITNVRGPDFPLYMLGAKMLEAYPAVPLFPNQGLGVALLSYQDKICWGFNADWDLVPDLHDFVEAIARSFAELYAAAEAVRVPLSPGNGAPAVKPRPRKKRTTPRGNGRQAARSQTQPN